MRLQHSIGKSLVLGCLSALCAAYMAACGSDDGDDENSDGSSTVSTGGSASGSGATSGSTGGVPLGTGLGGDSNGSGGNGEACAAENSAASLEPVYLAFAFDVSGSMGKLDKPYHDPELKWEPVVAATEAFFQSEDSSGLNASLTFFPIDDEDGRCDVESYDTPDVAMTALPSGAFAEAITAITPQSADEWRGGTPTLAVVEGTLSFLAAQKASNPKAHYALVLVTDGYPNGCDDDAIASVVDAVAAVKDEIPTYVIGVQNPEGGPDTVSDLEDIAVAGGTEKAFFIETGNPVVTQKAFQAAINGIREQSISCDVTIPAPPPGKEFDATKVNVTFTDAAGDTEFSYDPDCASENAWRYDDANAPTKIELCAQTCEGVQVAVEASLEVEFGCERRDVIR